MSSWNFTPLGKRAVLGKFDEGMISSDRGGLLLGEVEARTHIVERLAAQFTDHRDPEARLGCPLCADSTDS